MEIIAEWWGLIGAAIAGLFWLSRLEWRSVKNEADILSMREQRKTDLENAQRARADDLASAQAARDETNKMLMEMRTDIKQLLQRPH